MFRIGIDVGGTFTDLVAVDENGRLALAKAASTPADPSLGAMDGLQLLADVVGQDLRSLLGATERIVHGTTVATNALLERKGARVGLLTTAGHRDVLEMREGLKDDRYNLRLPPPVPLVSRALRLGVEERIRYDGSVETPLDQASLQEALETLAAAEVEAIAVCYLHAYANPTHEATTRDVISSRMPRAYLSLSSVVLPRIKEFERVGTTVVNAYVGPLLARYLDTLGGRLREMGYQGEVLVMQSHGGVVPLEGAAQLAAGAILSGAGGIAGARHSARLLETGDLISFDMGGTSTDISLLEDGEPVLTDDKSVGGQRIALPSIDIHTLGAGGGSIARVEPGGILRVGPASAGAVPGPACYGLGGRQATVTDANVVLGYLDPDNFLGGRTRLDVDAARSVVGAVAADLGMDETGAAAGIHRVVTTGMAEGIRLVAARRGVDPRRFTLLAFGGAAGLHIVDVARLLEIGRVVVPRTAAVLSAWGMLATDLRYEQVATHIGELSQVGSAELRRRLVDLEQAGRTRLARTFVGEVEVQRSLDMRYGEQIFEIAVPLDGVDVEAEDLVEQAIARFHQRHEQLFTYSAPDQEVVLVNARVAVIGKLPPLPAEPEQHQAASAAVPGRRRAFVGAWQDLAVHDLDALAPGESFAGPALFESATTTVLLREGDRAAVISHGWLDVRPRLG